MFKMIDRPEFTHDVSVMIPVDTGHREEKLKTTFRALPDDEADEFDLNTAEGTKNFLRNVIVQFADLADTEGKPVAYSPEARDKLLKHAFIRLALVRAYFAALTKERVGN